jgi:hypothetical protein
VFFRHVFKAFVFILTILSVNLLTAYLDNHLSGYRGQYDALTFTLLGMTVIVIVFYPLFAWLDHGVDRLAREFLSLGNRLIGRKVGMFLAFIAGFYGLFYLYGKMWFGINLHPRVLALLNEVVQNLKN